MLTLKRVTGRVSNLFVLNFLSVVLILAVAILPSKLNAQCTQLVWADEFEGTSLDQTKWAYVLGRGCDTPAGCGFGNGEEQSYTKNASNISISGGNLTITAIANNPEPGATFSSAKIQTLGLKTFQYGKIEAKMKLSSGKGAWPAFWMLAKQNNWPYTGEVDIMEAKHKNPTQLIGTVHHYNGFTSGQVTTPDLSAAFHTYAIEWERDEIRWYFDGELFHKASPQTTGGAWPFNDTGNPFYLILNLAVGGLGTPFTGNQAFNAADFPTSLQVDYVRVYSGSWNVEFTGDPFVYKNENNKIYSVTAVDGAGYNWVVPAGVTIISGQGTNKITVDFGSDAVSGDVKVDISSGCDTQTYKKFVTVEEAFKISNILKDWDANNNMTFKSASGTLTQVVNPSGTGNVGKYIRNAGQLYDNIVYNKIAFGNASDFVTRRRRIHADFYTNAPVGTKLRIQLENSAKSAQQFPVGRHSVYESKTTVQNQWETVEFEYVNSPDVGTGANTVDQIAFLLAVETNSNNTYYIDNVVIGTAGDPCPRIVNQTLEDFQDNRNLVFKSSTGTLSLVDNPNPSGVNASAQVGKYIRKSSELYDVLFYKDVNIPSLPDFKNGKSAFKMHVNTAAPIGTVISLQLETNASTPNNYPTGRHSLYQAVTTVQNQWELVEFNFVSALDALAKDEDVNTLVFLYAPGTNTGATYYFDNLLTETENCSGESSPTVSITSPVNNTNFPSDAGISISATAGDADGLVTKVEFFNGSTLLGEDTSSPYGFEWTNVPDGSYSLTAKATDDSGLTATSYTVKVTVGTVNSPPTTSITSPLSNTIFTAPASITINAEAADEGGTVAKVEFYNGDSKLGEDLTSPYSFTWTDVTEGSYSLTTKVFDNLDSYSNSSAVNVSVVSGSVCSGNGPNAPATDTPDYSWLATNSADPTITFIPGTPITGCDFVILYAKIGAGGYAGYIMNAAGANFTYAITAAAASSVSVYFTYRISAGGAERNSSATPGSFIVGQCIDNSNVNTPPSAIITSPLNNASLTAPASIEINANASDVDGTITKVEFYNGTTLLGTDSSSPYSYNWTNVSAGNYALTVKATDDGDEVTVSSIVNIKVVTSSNGTCVHTSQFGDYTVEIAGASANPTFKFVPAEDGVGTPTCLFYHGTTPDGNYGGSAVTPNVPFEVTAALGTEIYFYFTYSVPSGGEQNTSAYRDSYMVGDMCEVIAAVDEGQGDNDNVYPNPVDETFMIKGAKNSTATILNAQGVQVLYDVLKTDGVNVSPLAPGVYIIMIKKKNNTMIRRFVKR
jgi:beta-glucanase (GH16 family)